MTPPNGAPDEVRPTCQLVGTDGNVFAIIGRVREALRGAGLASRVKRALEAAGASAGDEGEPGLDAAPRVTAAAVPRLSRSGTGSSTPASTLTLDLHM